MGSKKRESKVTACHCCSKLDSSIKITVCPTCVQQYNIKGAHLCEICGEKPIHNNDICARCTTAIYKATQEGVSPKIHLHSGEVKELPDIYNILNRLFDFAFQRIECNAEEIAKACNIGSVGEVVGVLNILQKNGDERISVKRIKRAKDDIPGGLWVLDRIKKPSSIKAVVVSKYDITENSLHPSKVIEGLKKIADPETKRAIKAAWAEFLGQ